MSNEQTKTTLSDAPCDKCGYNGPGYYQPETHSCAKPQMMKKAEALWAQYERGQMMGRDND